MTEEEKKYNCEVCKQKTLTVREGEYGTEGHCSNCGHSFKETNYFKMLNKYSGIMAVFALVFILVFAVLNGGQFDTLDAKINNLGYGMKQDIIDNHNILVGLIENVSHDMVKINLDIDNLQTRLLSAETNINTLSSLSGDISSIRINLTKMDDNISKLYAKFNSISGQDILSLVNENLTIKYYPNQTGDTRYCHLNFSIEDDGLDIQEIKYMVSYPKTNISLLNWSSSIKPQEYNWSDGNYSDNYYISWYGHEDKVYANFNITWHISDYNTNNLSKSGIKDVVIVNSVVTDIVNIWERYF